MPLTDLRSGKKIGPRKLVLYGCEGIGKTTFGTDAPNSVVIPTEDGLDDIDCQSYPLCKTFDEVMSRIGELYTEEHDRQTVVIDSLDWLERLIWDVVCRQWGVDAIDKVDGGYGKGYGYCLPHWRQFLDGLDALRIERGLTCICIAHAKIKRFDNPETDSYDRYMPRLHDSAAHIVTEWANDVLFATYRVYTTSTEVGFNKERVKGVGSGERIIRTNARPACVAKNKLNLPDELDLNWQAYAAYLPK